MNIAILASSLQGGGAEKIATELANSFCQKKTASIFYLAWTAENAFFQLDKEVQFICLGGKRKSNPITALFNVLNRILILRRTLKKNKIDIVYSFVMMNSVTAILASLFLDIKIIAAERSNPNSNKLGKAWRILRKYTFKHAHALILQTHGVLDEYKKIGVNNKNIIVIPNFIEKSEFAEMPYSERQNNIVFLGRLTGEKGCETLINAFNEISQYSSDYQLLIAGNGPLKEHLENTAGKSILAGSIQFLGHIKNPEKLLSTSKIYVICSKHEGFPNALCEAMANGCACIAFDCPFGPAEIIENEKDGLLIVNPDQSKLASAIKYLIQNPLESERLSQNARLITQKFNKAEIIEKWWELTK